MFNTLKRFFDSKQSDVDTQPLTLNRACAALMVEAAAADGHIEEAEKALLHKHLCQSFAMSESEADELMTHVIEQSDHTTHLLRFTRTIKEEMAHDARLELMEQLWTVVLADGHVDPYEDQLLRRIAGLIYVTDQERGKARKRAEAQAIK